MLQRESYSGLVWNTKSRFLVNVALHVFGNFYRKLLKYALRAEKMAASALRADSTLSPTLVVIRFCYLRRSPWTMKVIVCVTIIAVSYESSVMEARDQGSGQLSTG